MMGATLANMGANPITGEQVFNIQGVKDILSIMLTCGMYDYSGEWTYRVGMPAKSGVAGGVLAVVNRQLGHRGVFAGALERIAKHARRIVFLTAPLKTPHPFFQQPNPARVVAERIERLIEISGVEWTFLRAGMFAGNARHFWGPQIRTGDVVRWPYLNAPTAPTDERDVAAVAVRTLREDRHAGAEYVVTGPQSLTQGEQVRTIGRAIGRSLRVEEISPDEARSELLPVLHDMDNTVEATDEPHELQGLIEHLHGKYQPLAEGEVATYIPELGRADPESFGIALATPDGRVFQTGDSLRPFTIQSISKPFTYGMAIEEFGFGTVSRYVGVEPSGDTFNSIELHSPTNRPFNPMVNTGCSCAPTTRCLCQHATDHRC
jgi:glutaminase